MKTKLNKILTTITAATFVAALAINVQASFNDPFAGMSDEAMAQTTSSATSETTGIECETTITHETAGDDPICGIISNVWYNCNWGDSDYGSCQDGLVQTSECGVIIDSVWEIDCETGEHTGI